MQTAFKMAPEVSKKVTEIKVEEATSPLRQELNALQEKLNKERQAREAAEQETTQVSNERESLKNRQPKKEGS